MSPTKEPPSQDGRTLFTEVDTGDAQVNLTAQHFDAAIDLDALAALFPPNQVVFSNPLFLRSPDGHYVVIHRFGVVVSWGCAVGFVDLVCRKIRELIGPQPRLTTIQESLDIQIGKSEDQVNFKDIWLQKLTQEHIKIISETFGQSIALKQCEATVAEALTKVVPVVDALKRRGSLIQGGKEIVKLVGFVLDVRQTVLAKLTLFDPPPETLQSERLSRLHNLLYDHFDIRQRLAGLDAKVAFVTDLNETVLNLLQNRDGHRLEWIVIVLIMVEVAMSLIMFFNGSH
jgi:required for meiotic nuclear division protein 1